MVNAARAFGIVAVVAGRHALMAGCGVVVTFDNGENGCMQSASVRFEDIENECALEFDLLLDDIDAFRGLVELAIFKYRNAGALP